MAKDPDNLAADFDTEPGGGLLAEEDTFDRRMMWRLGSWGVGAIGAVVVAVMANQSALTLKRDQVAAVDISRQAQQLQTLAKESHNETRRLASAIDTLNSDRDRLYSRVSSLEQGLDSVTGAITKQATAPVATPSSSTAAPGPAPIPVNAPPAQPAVPAPAPAVAPVASTPPAADKPAADKSSASTDAKAAGPAEKPSAATEKPVAADKKPAPAPTKPQAAAEKPASDNAPPASAPAASIASPMTAAAAASADDAKPTAPSPSAALVADKPAVASSDTAAGKPIEPVKPPAANEVTSSPMPPLVVNADPDSEVEDDAGAPKAQIQRTEFGVDLGTANSVNGLRALWRGLVKAKANAPLLALQPIIVIKENTNGLGMQLRLVAGPLRDAGTAAKICASLSPAQRTAAAGCRGEEAGADHVLLDVPPQQPMIIPRKALRPDSQLISLV